MRRLGIGLLTIVLGGLPQLGCDAPPVAWRHNLAAARATAAAEGKPMLVFFHADWDVASKELRTHTFADRAVRRRMARFVAVEVDCTDEDAPSATRAVRELGAIGTPTLILLAPDGKTEVRRWSQYLPPADLASALW
jgi:thiol:disulfide interchange protein DsbD